MQVNALPDTCSEYASAVDAVSTAISFIENLLSGRWKKIRGESETYSYMRRNMPYVIHRTELDGTFILVNRNYKPVGSELEAGSPKVKYEGHTNLHVQLTSRQLKSIGGGVKNYLFGGGVNPPWDGRRDAAVYLERLKRLAREL